jgi:tetratricopeptide (TPR) repeat protein
MASFWQNKPEMIGRNDQKNALKNILSRGVSYATTQTKIEEADLLNSQNQLEKAYGIYKNILGTNAKHADALFGIGLILEKQQKFDLAIQFLSKAIESKPDKIEALLARGRIFRLQGMFQNAIANFTEVIAKHPDHFEALIARGITFGQTSKLNDAIQDFTLAIRSNPNCAEAFYNRGVVYEKLHQFESAIDEYSIAIKLNPYDYKAYNNRGVARRETKCFDAAIRDFDKSIKINPDFAEGYYNKALTLLSIGKLKEGFRLYEYRWKTAHFQSQLRHFSQPLWLGNADLTGKTILLHSEQGLGDGIQFCRYIKCFEAFNCTVFLEVEKPLIKLMECLLPSEQIFEKDSSLPSFDYHCPLMSLPFALSKNTKSIPYSERYLSADIKQIKSWKSHLVKTKKLRVGICWRGNSEHVNDHKRSINLSSIIDLIDDSFAWVSLQYDANQNELELINSNKNITHFGQEIGDFAKTAALVMSLDAVISVDTSMAHLAGAIGKRVFLMLSDVADARWKTTGSATPWYQNTVLIRQKSRLRWRPSIQRAKKLVSSRTRIQI